MELPFRCFVLLLVWDMLSRASGSAFCPLDTVCAGQTFTGAEEALRRPAHSSSWLFSPFLRIFYAMDATSVLLRGPPLLLLLCPLALEDAFSGLSPCHLPPSQVIPTGGSLSPMPTRPLAVPSPGFDFFQRKALTWDLRICSANVSRSGGTGIFGSLASSVCTRWTTLLRDQPSRA